MRRTLALLVVMIAPPAMARSYDHDPCTAPLPLVEGARFVGAVRYVGDGDSICVGATPAHVSWIEVRLADFDAPELNERGGAAARAIARRALLGRQAQCVTVRGRNGRTGNYDRVFARCRIGGRDVGAILRAAGAVSGGR
jgi:endonuclease YncB( thermonuclease family)